MNNEECWKSSLNLISQGRVRRSLLSLFLVVARCDVEEPHCTTAAEDEAKVGVGENNLRGSTLRYWMDSLKKREGDTHTHS